MHKVDFSMRRFKDTGNPVYAWDSSYLTASARTAEFRR